MKLKFIILHVALGLLFSAESPTEVTNDTGFQYSFKSNGNGLVKFSTPEYTFDSFEGDDGKIYKKPVLSNSSFTSNAGLPDLPSRTTFIAVDPSKNYSIEISYGSTRSVEDIDIAPKGSWDSNNNEIVATNINYESVGSFYPSAIAVISEPMAMRELSLLTLTVSPFRYFPEDKRLEEFLNIEIELIESGNRESSMFYPSKRSRAFEPLYESEITNLVL